MRTEFIAIEARDQIAARENGFTMTRALAAVGHPVSYLKVCHSLVLINDEPCARVAERSVLAEFRSDFARGTHRASLLHHFPNLAQVRRVLRHLLEHAVLMNVCGLCAAADQGIERANQNMVGQGRGVWHFAHDNLFESFAENLFHLVLSTSVLSSGTGRPASSL
jgi:hypothetical protein